MKYYDAWIELKTWLAMEGFSIMQLDTSAYGRLLANQYKNVLDKINELEEKHE